MYSNRWLSKFLTNCRQYVECVRAADIVLGGSVVTVLEAVISTFSGEMIRKEEERKNLWNSIVNHGVDKNEKGQKSAWTTGNPSRRELLLPYTENDR